LDRGSWSRQIKDYLEKKAREERSKNNCLEFKLMTEMIVQAIKTGKDYTFGEFSVMMGWLWASYQMEIKGHIMK
jgi:hypothetical protein